MGTINLQLSMKLHDNGEHSRFVELVSMVWIFIEHSKARKIYIFFIGNLMVVFEYL